MKFDTNPADHASILGLAVVAGETLLGNTHLALQCAATGVTVLYLALRIVILYQKNFVTTKVTHTETTTIKEPNE
jgi:hypothetical protein